VADRCLPKDIVSPSDVTTCRPSRRLPTVGAPRRALGERTIQPGTDSHNWDKSVSGANFESKRESPRRCPYRPSAKSMAAVSSSAPVASRQTSMTPAHTRTPETCVLDFVRRRGRRTFPMRAVRCLVVLGVSPRARRGAPPWASVCWACSGHLRRRYDFFSGSNGPPPDEVSVLFCVTIAS